jgi:hypothetical protein
MACRQKQREHSTNKIFRSPTRSYKKFNLIAAMGTKAYSGAACRYILETTVRRTPRETRNPNYNQAYLPTARLESGVFNVLSC